MIDIHMHVIQDVDDGAVNLEEAVEMLQKAAKQGAEVVFATSHSDAFAYETEKTRTNYRKLKKAVRDKQIPIEIYLGSEVYCAPYYMEENLKGLKEGRIPSLNGTKYVLVDFYNPDVESMRDCLEQLIKEGWKPIIAHPERYRDITIENYKYLKERGCFLQINLYSLVEESNEETKEISRELLRRKLVDFCGSDAHRLEHRPPNIESGISYVLRECDPEYARSVLSKNAEELFIKNHQTDSVTERDIWLDGMMGLVVGDALGLPVQFCEREELEQAPVTEMDCFGVFDMPMGAWSDDGSMALATLASLKERLHIDLNDIMDRFVDWLDNGAYTPTGVSYDMGATCTRSILNYKKTKDSAACGVTGEYANGNGALMRILPVCLFAYRMRMQKILSDKEAIEVIHGIAALTHDHLRSCMACGIYYFLITAIMNEDGSLKERLQSGIDKAMDFYKLDIRNYVELAHYGRILNIEEFARSNREDIKSTGYVVDSLEAAIWSLANTDSYETCLLRAVNLGLDTDTIGAIAGGLAGLFYGYENIPFSWRSAIIKREEITELCLATSKIW